MIMLEATQPCALTGHGGLAYDRIMWSWGEENTQREARLEGTWAHLRRVLVVLLGDLEHEGVLEQHGHVLVAVSHAGAVRRAQRRVSRHMHALPHARTRVSKCE